MFEKLQENLLQNFKWIYLRMKNLFQKFVLTMTSDRPTVSVS